MFLKGKWLVQGDLASVKLNHMKLLIFNTFLATEKAFLHGSI